MPPLATIVYNLEFHFFHPSEVFYYFQTVLPAKTFVSVMYPTFLLVVLPYQLFFNIKITPGLFKF